MRASLACVLLPVAAQAANIILGNDDGWAEINVRTLYNSLTAAGESVVLSSPATDKSGTGSLTATPSALTSACEFNSCPAGSPAEGFNASDTRLNYVNSYPATAMEYGINTLAPTFFGGAPDFAVTGVNVGVNLGIQVPFSGTVGAAVEAMNLGIPAVVFSGYTGSQTAWNVTTPLYSQVYADLATNITSVLLASGAPYLPANVWLNVNFPAATSTTCSSASDYKFVLSRIWTAIPLISAADVETCGSTRLPLERTVVDTTSDCYVSISVGDGDKLDANATLQGVVLEKLQSILTCLP
ncbi:hypothetical protein BP6252_04887 [Coleophoma cylindrospora]|uniref:Survival protein SurE-like phosphatase/nucleotidase domain-containing protein n=1 Tax=Coleophoma cylindrospora TaxID=1849047 RepID=A0A3D8S1S9_9HELO|nr:hypothetical protein BP6252_04887 [Coleophoma cylindrospora]